MIPLFLPKFRRQPHSERPGWHPDSRCRRSLRSSPATLHAPRAGRLDRAMAVFLACGVDAGYCARLRPETATQPGEPSGHTVT